MSSKLLITLSLAGLIAVISFMVTFSAASHQNAAENDGSKYGYGSVLLENAYNPIIQKLILGLFELTSDLESIIDRLSTSTLSAETLAQIRSSLGALPSTQIPLNLQYACLLAVILWPVALLLCPVGYCVVCLVCLLLDCVICAVVLLLFILGAFLFYSGPLANGAVPAEATGVVGSILQSMGRVGNETVDAFASFMRQGNLAEAVPVMTELQRLVTIFDTLGSQLKSSLTDEQTPETLSSTLGSLMKMLTDHLGSIGVQIESLVKEIPYAEGTIKEMIYKLMKHIEEIMEKIQK